MNDLKPKTMTIKDLSKALSVSRDLIEKRIKEIFPDKMQKGVTTYLNEYEVTTLKCRIQENSSIATSDDRRKLVDMPKTELEKELIIKQAMMFQNDKITLLTSRAEKAELKVIELTPKAEFAEKAIRDEKEHYSITQAGKHLDISQKQIFAILREYSLLTMENLPTQKAINLKLLQLRTNPNCNGRNRQQAIMTMENIYNFKNRYL